MTDHDELLARADEGSYELVNAGYEVAAQLVTDLAAALRAALATRLEPLFEGEVGSATEWADADGTLTGQVLIDTTTPWRSDLNGKRVVAYEAAVAGSATPTSGFKNEGRFAVTAPDGTVVAPGEAWSATPTEENDDDG
jgi:hypothetical protein